TRNCDQHHGHTLSEILSETRSVQRIDKELVEVGGAAINNGQSRETRFRFVWCELKTGDVPVDTVKFVPYDVPLCIIAKTVCVERFQFLRIECTSRGGVSECFHGPATVGKVPG